MLRHWAVELVASAWRALEVLSYPCYHTKPSKVLRPVLGFKLNVERSELSLLRSTRHLGAG